MTNHEEIVNLPDLSFVRYCKIKYDLNRGVYNTIDEWLYKKEVEDITLRRKFILEFLLFFVHSVEHNGKIGKGNLTNFLNKYWDRQHQ